MKSAFILGTRPEIIKLSPLIRHATRRKKPFILIHTGQHYSYEMDTLFFKELELPQPKYHLEIRSAESGGHAGHTGRMMTGIEKILLAARPAVVFVQGDTNSVLAGALATSKIHGMRLAHVEAGLRSYDRSMPEEINRVMADHVSDFLFAPTLISKKNLLTEGIPKEKIFITGNTIVDALRENLMIAKKRIRNLNRWIRPGEDYFLMTLHRQENVDQKERLALILKGLKLVVRKFNTKILFPIHPRTRKMLEKFRITLPVGVLALEPVGFLDFLRLEEAARLILTDSGGVQEEACILGVPSVTIRTTTERPETVLTGANLVAGFRPDSIVRCAEEMIRRKRNWKNPFGDGRAGERMLRIAEERFS